MAEPSGSTSIVQRSRLVDGRRPLNAAERQVDEVLFDLGDGDDMPDAPPAYDSLEVRDHSRQQDGQSEVSDLTEETAEVVEVIHQLRRTDTILSVARQYAADPHELLTLNDLPPSVMSTTPHLLRTRKTLVISRRRVSDKAHLHPSESQPEDEETCQKRQREREVKRFQLVTKTVDPGVGRAYLSLEDEVDALDSQYQGETKEGGKKISAPRAEERAVGRYWEDEDWERVAAEPTRSSKGKWRVVTGMA